MNIHINVCAAHVYIKMPMYVEARGQPTVPSSEMHSSPLRQGPPLAYISPLLLNASLAPWIVGPLPPRVLGYHSTAPPHTHSLHSGPHACQVSTLLGEHLLTHSPHPPHLCCGAHAQRAFC